MRFDWRRKLPRSWVRFDGRRFARLALVASVAPALLGAASPIEFTVAALRVTPSPWEKNANIEKLERYARQAAQAGAQMIVTPEGFLDGYVGNDASVPREDYFSIAEPVDGPPLRRVRKLADELDVYLALGFPELRGELVYNSVAIFGPDGELVSLYSKTHCGSEPYNTEGVAFPVVKTPLGVWGTLICLDRQLPETARILAIKGAQIIFNPSYGMYGEINDVMMRTRAYENSVYVVFVHPKRALIIEPDGTIAARDDGTGDQIVYGRIRLDERIGRGPIRDRRPEIYGALVEAPAR